MVEWNSGTRIAHAHDAIVHVPWARRRAAADKEVCG